MDEINALIQSLIQQVLQNQDQFSEEELRMIFEVLRQAVEYVQAQGIPEEAPIEAPTPEVQPAEFPSSNVNGYAYNPDSGDLLVQFHGPYPQADGPVYKYSGVGKNIYDLIARGGVAPRTSGKNKYHEWVKGMTPSHGASVNALLKESGIPYQRVA